jgi:hypothetical protein
MNVKYNPYQLFGLNLAPFVPPAAPLTINRSEKKLLSAADDETRAEY